MAVTGDEEGMDLGESHPCDECRRDRQLSQTRKGEPLEVREREPSQVDEVVGDDGDVVKHERGEV